MRIAQISYHTCPLASEEGKETGGMNVYVYNLSLELAKLGHQIDVFTRSEDPQAKKIVQVYPAPKAQGLSGAGVAPNFRVIHLPAGPEKTLPKKELINFIPEFTDNLQRFVETAHRGRPYDILHAHYYMSGLAVLRLNQQLTTCLAGRRVNKQQLTRSRNGSRPFPTIITFHTLSLLKNLVARSEAEPVVRVEAEMELVKKADKIIAPSAVEREYLHYFYAANENKIEVIPPGFDSTIFHPMDKTAARRKIGADPQHKIILFVGRIEPLKGLDVLMYALKILVQKCPDCQICLWIVGGEKQNRDDWHSENGNEARFRGNRQTVMAEKTKDVAERRNPELKKLYQLRDTLGLQNYICFVPQQHQHELPFYYNAANVVVMTSHYESFGMSALEAMACGMPVVTTNVTGISTMFENSDQHLVISANNPLQLAEAIEKIISAPDHEIVHRKIADFTWKKMAGKMVGVYENLLAPHHG